MDSQESMFEEIIGCEIWKLWNRLRVWRDSYVVFIGEEAHNTAHEDFNGSIRVIPISLGSLAGGEGGKTQSQSKLILTGSRRKVNLVT